MNFLVQAAPVQSRPACPVPTDLPAGWKGGGDRLMCIPQGGEKRQLIKELWGGPRRKGSLSQGAEIFMRDLKACILFRNYNKIFIWI